MEKIKKEQQEALLKEQLKETSVKEEIDEANRQRGKQATKRPIVKKIPIPDTKKAREQRRKDKQAPSFDDDKFVPTPI